jgi:hypothetical protein
MPEGGVRGQVQDWPSCLAQREQVICKQGSVLHFTEALIHSGMAVLGETTRYAMFMDFTAPWWKGYVSSRAASAETAERANGELAAILGRIGESNQPYAGQWGANAKM